MMASDDDDDFLPPTQFSTQQRGPNRQAVTSTSRSQAWDRLGPSRPSQSSHHGHSQSQGRPSQSQSRPSQEEELSQIQDGIKFLMERVQQLTGNSRGIKRSAEPKPLDKKPDTKEQCQLCKKYYANKTTLFRHYRAMHGEMHPEKYHGCSVNSTVVSLDSSFRENTCGICEYVAASQNALDTHNRDVHGNVGNTSSRDTCGICGYAAASQNALDTHNRDLHGNVASNNANRAVANVNSGNDVNTDVASASNKENISNNAINRLHKCDTCACYFEERNKFDEHMKAQHGYQFVCHICNKHLLFKDVDAHVKEVHPDVYKDNKEKNEKVIVEKMMRNKKGNRVLVFVCTKCDLKMVDKTEAERHARGHKKGLKIKVAPRVKEVAPRSNCRVKVSKVADNITDVTSNAHVIFTCDACDISTGSYDAAVMHAQNHKTNNLNDIVTQQCQTCALKFEPLCLKDHVDLHYKNEEIHRESFRYFKYIPQALLYEDCLNKEPELKKIIDESIYRHTRTVRMRVMQQGTYNLYKCCQCDNYVEPAAVLNHAINYDTCVKVKCSYTCDICERKFNNRLAINSHAKNHKREEHYKTVLFNHENDKKFNKILNNINDDAEARKVLYKCLCGLCFVSRENADDHLKRCPGKDKKTLCPKCNNFFNSDELLAHCNGQHSDHAQIIIENITPDVIIIDEDEESENIQYNHADIIEIDDDDEAPTEMKIEVLTNGDAETGFSEEAETRNRSASGVLTEADDEQLASEGNLLIAKSERDIDEDEDKSNDDFGATDDITDDNSQDTINYENTVTATEVVNHVMTEENKVKCVPTNLLLNPLHFKKKVGVCAEITDIMTSISQELQTTRALSNVLLDTIKNKESWFDPTNFSNIRSRPSLRHPAPSNLSQDIVDLLLTDDEETEMNHDEGDTEINENIRTEENSDTLNEVSENTDMRENLTNKTSNTTITEHIQNVGTVDMNDIQHTSNNEHNTAIMQNEENHIEELARENNVDVEAQPELTTMNGQGVTDVSTHSHEEAINNEQNYSDDEDDLFIPSGIDNHEKSRHTELNNEREMSNKEQLATQVDSEYNKSQYDNNIEETEVESANNKSESHNNIEKSGGISVENPQDDAELNDIRPDETNILHTESNGTGIDKETGVSTEHIQNNFDDDTQEYVESTLKETTTEITEREVRESISEKQTVHIKKEFSYADINIKRELIEENVQESENVSQREVRIKPEPIDYNENKENDIFVINNVDNVNYNHCSIY